MTKITKRVLSSAKKIIDDNKNANLLLDILEHFEDEEEEVVIACCTSVGKVFNHFTLKTSFLETEVTKKEDLSKDDQFHSWLQEQYTTTCDILFNLLNNDSVSVQISALEALILILSGLGENSKTSMPRINEIVEKIMTVLLDSEADRGKLISQLPGLFLACGEGGEVVTTCLTCLKYGAREGDKKVEMNDAKAFNIWHVVTQIAGSCEMDIKAKGVLNKIVLNFLKQEVPIKLYKEILTGIAPVMEKMTNPLLLADFLSQSFNIGGAISLMSLNGLFVLMHQYNLNYPDFYEKLYSMFQPQIFGAKYRARFFHLADLFLSSTHLPSYLIAAFVKKLARLSLHAPASGVHIAVPFIFSLIKRHPACDVLLHRTEGEMELDSDPFLDDEPPAKCKALESCIWELRTLEHHFDPTISIKSRKRQIKEVDLGTFLEKTTTEIMAIEVKKKKKDVALTFGKFTDFNLFEKFVL